MPHAKALTTGGLLACAEIALGASATAHHHWAAIWNLGAEVAAAGIIAGLRAGALGIGRVFSWRPVLWLGTRSCAIYTSGTVR